MPIEPKWSEKTPGRARATVTDDVITFTIDILATGDAPHYAISVVSANYRGPRIFAPLPGRMASAIKDPMPVLKTLSTAALNMLADNLDKVWPVDAR